MADNTRQNNTRYKNTSRDVDNQNQQVVKPLPFKPVKPPMPLQNLIGTNTAECSTRLQQGNLDPYGNPILDARQMRRLCRDLFRVNSISRPPIKPENVQELIKDEKKDEPNIIDASKEKIEKSNIIRNTKEI